jgi:hypothetical protein
MRNITTRSMIGESIMIMDYQFIVVVRTDISDVNGGSKSRNSLLSCYLETTISEFTIILLLF